MATTTDVNAFMDLHLDKLTAGPTYDRALRTLVSDAMHFARIGSLDQADAYLGQAIVHVESGTAHMSYGWDRFKARARSWTVTHTRQPQPKSFYVRRTHQDSGRVDWTGPHTSASHAEQERAARDEAGWLAEIVPNTREVRDQVHVWEQQRRQVGAECPLCERPYSDPAVRCLFATDRLLAWCDIRQTHIDSATAPAGDASAG